MRRRKAHDGIAKFTEMKWLRTMILFDKGELVSSPDWKKVHESYVRSIKAVKNPEGSRTFKIRERIPIPRLSKKEDQKFERNGVSTIQRRFYHHLTNIEKWEKEKKIDYTKGRGDLEVPLRLYPTLEEYREPLGASFGPFDFVTVGPTGLKVAIEWETGNISSSHRSINKLCVCLNAGIVDVGVIIVPSRPLYRHLTDRIGNIDELSGYLSLWQSIKIHVERGLLAISVVEHDHTTTNKSFPLLDRLPDGRAAEGKRNLERRKNGLL